MDQHALLKGSFEKIERYFEKKVQELWKNDFTLYQDNTPAHTVLCEAVWDRQITFLHWNNFHIAYHVIFFFSLK